MKYGGVSQRLPWRSSKYVQLSESFQEQLHLQFSRSLESGKPYWDSLHYVRCDDVSQRLALEVFRIYTIQ